MANILYNGSIMNFVTELQLSKIKEVKVTVVSDESLQLDYYVNSNIKTSTIVFKGFVSVNYFKDATAILVPYIKRDGKLLVASGFGRLNPKMTDKEGSITIVSHHLFPSFEANGKKIITLGVEISGETNKEKDNYYSLLFKKEFSPSLKETIRLVFEDVGIEELGKVDKKLLQSLIRILILKETSRPIFDDIKIEDLDKINKRLLRWLIGLSITI